MQFIIMTQNYHPDNLKQIFEEATRGERGLFKLLQIGRTYGFDNFINRKLIWPFLLGLDQKILKSKQVYEWKVRSQQKSPQFSEIVKDSQRSFSSLKMYESVSKFHLMKKQEAVQDTLNSLFINNHQLNYIQGFHDIASIFLTIFDNSMGYYLTQKAAQIYFYDYLTFEAEVNARITSEIVYSLVTMRDQSFKNIFLFYHESKILIFIFPWVMTWFSHVFSSVKQICRVWDYLLCSGPHGIFYLTSALILKSKTKLIQSCESYNQANITSFYQEYIKSRQIQVEEIIKTAIQLELKIDLKVLPAYQLFQPKSKFRYEVFSKFLDFHEKYQIYKHEQMKKEKNFKSFLVVGGAIALLGAAFLFKSKVKLSQIRDL